MNRLELLVRKNKGLKATRELILNFSKLNIDINENDFYGLEETDRWWKQFRERQNYSLNNTIAFYQQDFPEYESNFLKNILIKFSLKLRTEKVILYVKQSEFCGCIKIIDEKFLLNYENIMQTIDNDTLCFGSEDLENGCMIYFVEGIPQDKYRVFYTLQIWGNKCLSYLNN